MSDTPVLTPAVLKADHALHMFIMDLARGIFPGDEIATRWGFTDENQLRDWLRHHPKVVDKIKEQKSLNEADESVLDRVEHKYAHILDQGSTTMAAIVTDPTIAAADKIKVMELASKLSGAAAKTAPKGIAGPGNAPFVINFNFRNAPSETITTTVVEGAAIEVEQ